MKRLLLSFCGLAFIAGGASAQTIATGYHKDFKKKQTGDEQVYHFPQNTSRLTNYTDTIWYDAFDNPNTWAIQNQNTNGWVITTAAAGSTWYFANTDINSTSGGNFALLRPDTPNGTQSATFHTITTATPIDISAYSNQNLVLTYEKYGARFLDTLKVQVSNDGTNWTTLDLNVDFPLLSTAGGSVTANPASRDLFIPINIVNGNNLFVRFAWDADNANQPAIGYGWFVDDVGLFNVPGVDLVLDQNAWFEDVRLLYQWYYGAMPEEQAVTDQITWSSTFTNRGSNNVTGAQLELSISGQETATFTSASQTVNAGALADTARTTTVWAPTAGEGTYTITWSVISDSTDAIPSNNSVSQNLLVTDNEFSMAPLPISSANIVGKGGTGTSAYTLSQDYFFNAADTITSMGVAFDTEWSRVGASFQLSILDNEDQLMTASEIYLADECMITDDMVYFPVPEVAIEPGNYQARLEVFSDSLFLVACQDPIPPIEPAPGGGFFSRTTLSFGGSNFIEDMVYMTIRTKTNPTCNPNANVAGIFELNEEKTAASITILDVTGLSGCVFNYDWDGPGGFNDDSESIDDLIENGTYTIVVTDADGCTASADFDVVGVGINDNLLSSNVSLFPNPTKGDFNLQFNQASGNYTINVVNTLGQVVVNRQINVNGSAQTIEFAGLNLEKGVYTVSIQDTDNGAHANHKIVVQ